MKRWALLLLLAAAFARHQQQRWDRCPVLSARNIMMRNRKRRASSSRHAAPEPGRCCVGLAGNRDQAQHKD